MVLNCAVSARILESGLNVANVRYPVWPGIESIGMAETKDFDIGPFFSPWVD
jgi:hypothetical protein